MYSILIKSNSDVFLSVTWQVYCCCVCTCTALEVSSLSHRSKRKYDPTLDEDWLELDVGAGLVGLRQGDIPVEVGGGARRARLHFSESTWGSSRSLLRHSWDLVVDTLALICDWGHHQVNVHFQVICCSKYSPKLSQLNTANISMNKATISRSNTCEPKGQDSECSKPSLSDTFSPIWPLGGLISTNSITELVLFTLLFLLVTSGAF